MFMTSFAALVVSIRYYNRHKDLRIFTYYILFSFLQSLTELIVRTGDLDKLTSRTILASSENAFMLFEFVVCNYFILRQLTSVRRRKTLKINALIYFCFLLWVGVRHYKEVYLNTFFFFESIFLVLPCLLYFYELFVNIRPEPLKNQPSFLDHHRHTFPQCLQYSHVADSGTTRQIQRCGVLFKFYPV